MGLNNTAPSITQECDLAVVNEFMFNALDKLGCNLASIEAMNWTPYEYPHERAELSYGAELINGKWAWLYCWLNSEGMWCLESEDGNIVLPFYPIAMDGTAQLIESVGHRAMRCLHVYTLVDSILGVFEDSAVA